MTPELFREEVLPEVIAAWERRCFCTSVGFRKLVSFNFSDYGIGPTGLADAEILIDALIRQRFTPEGESEDRRDGIVRRYACPQCASTCATSYADFSISMYRSFATFDGGAPIAKRGLYLVGFYGLRREDFEKIRDFKRTDSAELFLQQLRGEGFAQ